MKLPLILGALLLVAPPAPPQPGSAVEQAANNAGANSLPSSPSAPLAKAISNEPLVPTFLGT